MGSGRCKGGLQPGEEVGEPVTITLPASEPHSQRAVRVYVQRKLGNSPTCPQAWWLEAAGSTWMPWGHCLAWQTCWIKETAEILQELLAGGRHGCIC